MQTPEPVDAEPADAEPVDAEPANAEPVDAEPANAEPVDAEPAEASRAATRRAVLRARARPWLITAIVLVVLAAGIGLVGGWKPASTEASRGRALPAGKEIRLKRWKVTVLDAEVVDVDPVAGYQTSDTIQLRLALVNRTEETSTDFPVAVLGQDPDSSGVLTIDSHIPERPDSVSGKGAVGQMGVDPQISQPWTVEIAYQGGIPIPAPDRIAVIVRDEQKTRSLASMADGYEIAEPPIGHVLVPLTDRRTR